MFVLARDFIGKMLDRLVGVEGTIEHIQFFLQNSQVSSIGTVLYMQNRVLMMFDLLNHTGILDVEDTKHTRLETSSKK